MAHNYLRIYLIFLKNELKIALTYRLSFIIEILVENGYNLVWLFLVIFLYQSQVQFPFFSKSEALVLTGLNFITTELILSICYITNLFDLPEKIGKGEIDYLLTKPVNSLFLLTLSRPYIAGLISTFPGFIILAITIPQLGPISLPRLLLSVAISVCGSVIAICTGILATTLSFKYPNARQIPRASSQLASELKSNPHTIYSGFISVFFTFILPINFISSIPVFALTHTMSPVLVIAPFILTIIFLLLTNKTWSLAIRHYSSASS